MAEAGEQPVHEAVGVVALNVLSVLCQAEKLKYIKVGLDGYEQDVVIQVFVRSLDDLEDRVDFSNLEELLK